jgi:hypothetical protein
VKKLALGVGAAALLAMLLGLILGGSVTSGLGQGADGACTPTIGLGGGTGTGAVRYPMAEGTYRISSGYGPRAATGASPAQFHRGLDFAAPLGTPIYAAHDGTVAKAGPASGFGTWVVIDGTLPDGTLFSTVYGHMPPSSLKVKEGDVVSAGQQLAVVGQEGQSTGPHLHFEVWPGTRLNGGASIDPAGWLSANAGAGTGSGAPAPDPAAADVQLNGPVPPQGRQTTMPITPERQANIDTIVGVVKGQRRPLRVAVIATAAAMQESTLRVIDFGDLAGPDSRGLYQQRTQWGPYEARMDPVQSTLYFLNGGAGGQRGLLSHDWEHLSLEQVVVQTQISVGGYAKWEAQAMQLVAAAAGVDPITAGAGPAPSPCIAL